MCSQDTSLNPPDFLENAKKQAKTESILIHADIIGGLKTRSDMDGSDIAFVWGNVYL
jgi:hypothetical protein